MSSIGVASVMVSSPPLAGAPATSLIGQPVVPRFPGGAADADTGSDMRPARPSVSGTVQPSYDGLALGIRMALDRVTPAIARAVRRFVEEKSWARFGFARIDDYARERIARSARWLRDLAALDRALADLPDLRRALVGDDGGRPIGQVAALAIGRIASPQSVQAWIDMSRRLPVRKFKKEIRLARERGSDRPRSDGDFESGRFPDGDPHREADDSPDPDRRYSVRLRMPASIRGAFDRTLALHRAVSGREGTVSSFIEALVGEAFAGPDPPPADPPPIRHSRDWAELEATLFRSTGQWDCLTDQPDPCELSAFETLVEAADLMRQSGTGDHVELDRQIRGLVVVEDRLQRELGQVLFLIGHERGFSKLGFVNLTHYAEQRLGLSGTTARDRVRVTRRLHELPVVREAYEAGRIGLEAASLIARSIGRETVGEQTERAWVERAERATLKRLRDESRALQLRRLDSAGQARPEPMTDEDWYASLGQQPGQIRDRVGKLGLQAAADNRHLVCVSLRLPGDLAADFMAAIEASRASLAWAVAQDSAGSDSVVDPVVGRTVGANNECDADSDSSTAGIARRLARLFSRKTGHVPDWVGLFAMLEDFVLTWDDPTGMPKRVADKIYSRDGWRCTAPGCTSRSNLESHHLEYRSRGGDLKDPSNQTTQCGFHHRQGEHGKYASVRGVAPLGLEWSLGQDGIAQQYRNELRV